MVDLDERVLSANASMLRLLSLPALEVLGRPLSVVAPPLGLARVLEAGIAENDTLERMGGHSLLVSRTPLRDHGLGPPLRCLDQKHRSEQLPQPEP